MSVHNYFCPRYCQFVLFGRAIWCKMGVHNYFVLDTVGAFYLVELWYKLSVHNYVCPCILFGRVMVQIECPQLPLSSILSVHFIW